MADSLNSRFGLSKVIQSFPRPRVEKIRETVHEQLARSGIRIAGGASIAIATGSRGIGGIDQIVKAVVDYVRGAGGAPFVVPAMGSHGGATAEGQAELLASYGITEAAMECSIRSSMEVVPLPGQDLPTALFMDRHAWEADGVILINRIKPHTDFRGPYESGLMKMAVIGLGKERQASEMHRHGVRGLREFTPLCARRVLETGKILGGLAIVENAYDETALIEAVAASAIPEREPMLLEIAAQNMPRLRFTDLDVLIVDRIGKNISGTGMDTNIIGRVRIPGEPERSQPRIGSIVVLSLTAESHGNATGIGLADVTTRHCFEQIDFAVTKKNIVTSSFLERGKIPVVADSNEEAVEIALRAAAVQDMDQARIVRIRDTLYLQEIFVSPALQDT